MPILLLPSTNFKFFPPKLKCVDMKLDTSGLESTSPFFGSGDELCPELLAAPSFSLPLSTDVSMLRLHYDDIPSEQQ